ncbi:unnamed protein product, partial [Meganyctiphanes norvegica]
MMEIMQVLLYDKETSLHDSQEDVNTFKNDNISQVMSPLQISENKINPESNDTKSHEEYTCVFCLEPGSLIQFCTCNVTAHKACVIEYTTYPGSMNDKCCMCRQKIEYRNPDEDSPLKLKYRILLTAIVMLVLLVASVSFYLHILFIPKADWNIFVYVVALSNLSMFYPLMIIVVIGFFIDYWSPRGRRTDSVCYCGHEDLPSLNYSQWTGDRGVGFAFMTFLCLLLIFVCVALCGIIYISYGILKFYRSFKLKSKKDICFLHERP